jgi:hypothetical protein
VVEHNPRFIRKLKVPVCLNQHPLPLAQLGLNGNDTFERKHPDGSKR